jgi:hypothetical protein
MRIRIIQPPAQQSIDGIRLDQFVPGLQYEVGHVIGSLMLAEGWAEPVPADDPADVIPLSELAGAGLQNPRNLIREIFPSYYDTPAALAADRRRTPRTRKRR